MYIELFTLILDDIFQLKYTPKVIRKPRLLWNNKHECWGLYYGETNNKGKIKHRIEYQFTHDKERIFTTIAHEYVHAWQNEHGLNLEHSEQKEFRKWKKYFEKHFNVMLE